MGGILQGGSRLTEKGIPSFIRRDEYRELGEVRDLGNSYRAAREDGRQVGKLVSSYDIHFGLGPQVVRHEVPQEDP